MATHSSRSQGFVLIAALILLFLLSGIAVGLLMLTTSETRISGNDRESNRAYYAAESGMEKLTSDLAALYQSRQSPTTADFNALAAFPPTNAMVGPATFTESITRPLDAGGNPISTWRVISSGSNQGLTALIVPLTLQVNAVRPSTADAIMTRNVEVALIPVFQFGVFSDSDLSYFNGPPFQFAGRVHTNSNFFPTPGGILTFGDKITVAGQIIRDRLANGFDSSGSYSNSVYIPNASLGCNSYIAGGALGGNCILFDKPQASWVGGIPPAGGTNSHTWTGYNGYVANTPTVKKLVLPFVAGGGDQIEIVRKPLQTEVATSALGSSRLYNKANIRILLADQIQYLHPERSLLPLADGQDIDLGAKATLGTTIPVTGAPGPTALAYAKPTVDNNWQAPTSVGGATTNFPLITGFLRVEFKNAAGNWIGVTNEWLGLGFARNTGIAPTVPGGSVGADLVHPNAVLRLQEAADRTCPAPSTCSPKPLLNDSGNDISAAGISQGTDFYPINFYDPREGELRDTISVAAACRVNGIMNAIEIDAGNLQRWLAGTIGATGNQVENISQNGYLLYFSDRRGMLPDPNSLPTPNILTGEYGFEDVVNTPTDPIGTPNGVLDQGEDLDKNGILDNWGAADVGDGFRQATVGNPYVQIDCMAQGRMNKVTGARHVLRLTDASRGRLPFKVNADGTIGGFTVASENPVYVWGDYNASTSDGAFVDASHAPAAVIADSVTLLSRNWDDEIGMKNATAVGGRPPTETYYRLAIAAGKSLTFSNPSGAISKDWGTDGGLHNFLRYIENWGGVPLHYNGSLVSLYYSQYATGTFKCCNTVYGAPSRRYAFDTLFLNPNNLPPGTPMFQDIVNLTYRQDFTPY